MTQKMIVEFEEGKEPGTVMKDVLKACKKVEPVSYTHLDVYKRQIAGCGYDK